MAHTPAPQHLRVVPPLQEHERAALLELAGHDTGGRPARIWRGQPRSRSPWLPCGSGCCLLPGPGPVGQHRAVWLRFLVREVVAPRAPASVARATQLGLGQVHRLDGTVLVRGPGGLTHLVSVTANRVSDTRSGPVRDRPGPEMVQQRREPRRRGPVVQLRRDTGPPPDPA
ncbi:MAG: hypothetical protein LH468_09960 [Nocardioides sp.]|nr:hypothetical protein [Nocardioides sp.]